jgi:uncharacterized membrane protein YkoI
VKRIVVVTVVVIALAALAAGIAIASGRSDDNSKPISGSALAKASAAALASTGGGSVTGTEIGDEEGYYEVEVTLDGGRQIDVRLDKGFDVLSSKADSEEPGDSADSGSEAADND